jgi:hypothetical protein
VALHEGLDRRALARFALRCARETTTREGRTVAASQGPRGRTVLKLLDRFAAGQDLSDADWASMRLWLTPGSRSLWQRYISRIGSCSLSNPAAAIEPEALALADPAVPAALARWAASKASARCAGAAADSITDQRAIRELHRRILHECVPCPFDPEADR